MLPGRDGYPVETLRYEALRTAVQDYELLKLTERTLPPDEAEALFTEAFSHILRAESIRDFVNIPTAKAETLFSLDPMNYQAARRLLLTAMVKNT